jgi:alkanesulfonate monooxygenase SsuD/methylene tetrahydromethanopterin reductase-like flavin-dependent oxidoreductase (luciferase family)
MKLSMFHLHPHRELPADFASRFESIWVTPNWNELVPDPARIGQFYNWTFDELIYAAEAGLDGICVNEHHANAYGMMPSPNLMGSVLARATNHLETAIVQMGSTLPTTSPPTRVAEEYAMLDQISGGRLVAGLPLGSAMDANCVVGIPPMEQRDRYREAVDLVLKAWQTSDVFPWNGRYYQLPNVNVWPKPIQQPHPPVWVPGLGSLSTWEYATTNHFCYCYLSYFGSQVGRKVMEGFWDYVAKAGADDNPFRAGYLQLVVVADTDAEAEKLYKDHVLYFFHQCLHWPSKYMAPPGHQDYASLAKGLRSGMLQKMGAIWEELKTMTWKDFVDRDFVMAGSPATVADKLENAVKTLRTGNLMALLHIGSMTPELTKYNIDLFAQKVMPKLSPLWEDEYENHWWPQRLRQPRLAGVTG